MKRVFKYELGENGEIVKYRGRFAQILHMEAKDGLPVMWAEMNDDYKEIDVEIIAIGTGWDVPEEFEKWIHIGSIVIGPYVWHYYMRPVLMISEKQDNLTLGDMVDQILFGWQEKDD